MSRTVDAGTATEPVARRWARRLETSDRLEVAVGHYLVVVPHPDDEVLMTGGLLCRLARLGAAVDVVAATFGGGAYPHRIDHDTLATIRRAEQEAALSELGIPLDRLIALGYRDGAVAATEDLLAEHLVAHGRSDTTVVAPWRHDGHPDHDAIGRAAECAAERLGCPLWRSLFWTWHRGDPAPAAATVALEFGHLDLTPAEVASKREAIGRHESQFVTPDADPVLHDGLIAPVGWSREYYLIDR